jgi:hypothetical protein
MERSSLAFLQGATAVTTRSEFLLTSLGTTCACSQTPTWSLTRSFPFVFGTRNRAQRESERNIWGIGRRPFSAISLFCPEPASYGGDDGWGSVWKSRCVGHFRIHFVTDPIVVHWIVARHSAILDQLAFDGAPWAWST